MDTIVIDDLTKEYRMVTALDGVSLSIEPGSFHCLIGPNGSGKTTLLRTLLGLLDPTSGDVTGVDSSVGVGFQRPNLYPDLTVGENLRVFGDLVGGLDDDWRATVLDVLGLEPVLARRAGELSDGFAKKLDLALALVDRPDLVVLDEPFADLDDVSKSRLRRFLAEYRAAERTILVSTHHVGEFENVLDRLTILDRGRVVLDERASDLELESWDSYQELYVSLVS